MGPSSEVLLSFFACHWTIFIQLGLTPFFRNDRVSLSDKTARDHPIESG
jgi:hypothetical protein